MNNQKIYLNQGLSNLENILSILKAKRIFIVCGGNSFLPISKTIKNLLKNFSTSYFRVMNSKPNISSIKSGIKEFDDFNPDIILAIGGGSVIDTAKLIKTLSGCSEKIEILIRKQKELESNLKIPFIALPTTAGSGSEATHFAVIYDGHKKYSINSWDMLPEQIILDFGLVKSMPNIVAYSSLFDALSQSTESYWSKFATEASQKYAVEAISLILNNFEEYVSTKSEESTTKIIKASNLSGRAINITKTTAPHALSYSLTSRFEIPHGIAVAMLIPETFRTSYHKATKLNRKIFDKLIRIYRLRDIEDFCNNWTKLMQYCNLPLKARDFGVKLSDVSLLIKEVNVQRLKGHPIELDVNDFEEILKKII